MRASIMLWETNRRKLNVSRHKSVRDASLGRERRTLSASSTISSSPAFHPRRTGVLGYRGCLEQRKVWTLRTWHTLSTFRSKRTARRTSIIQRCRRVRLHSSSLRCSIGRRTIGILAASLSMTLMEADRRTSLKSQKASPQTTCSTWRFKFISQQSFKNSSLNASFSLSRLDSGHLVSVWQLKSISFRMRSTRLTHFLHEAPYTLSILEPLISKGQWMKILAIYMTLMLQK